MTTRDSLCKHTWTAWCLQSYFLFQILFPPLPSSPPASLGSLQWTHCPPSQYLAEKRVCGCSGEWEEEAPVVATHHLASDCKYTSVHRMLIATQPFMLPARMATIRYAPDMWNRGGEEGGRGGGNG